MPVPGLIASRHGPDRDACHCFANYTRLGPLQQAAHIADGFNVTSKPVAELQAKAGFESSLQLHHGQAVQV